MAPEQYSGLPVDARSDQFSFCVSLWEAMYGERPFAGETVAALADSVSSGRITMPARARARPAWLRKVLGRGLQTDPAQRHPSMDALIEEVLRRSARGSPKVWLAAVGSAIATALIVTTWAAGRGESAEPPTETAPVEAPVEQKKAPAEPKGVENVDATQPAETPPLPIESKEPVPEAKTVKPAKKAVPRETKEYAWKWCHLESDTREKLPGVTTAKKKGHVRASDGNCYDCKPDDSLRDSVSGSLAQACEQFAKCYRVDCP
jgi:hypothetical protein